MVWGAGKGEAMAKREELIVIISPQGDVKVEIKGIKGPRCLDVVKRFEQHVGLVTQRQPTSEFYEPAPPVRIDTTATEGSS